MCVIIYRPADHKLDRKTLANCASDNPDGWGIMVAHQGFVLVYRGMEKADFFTTYDSLPPDVPMGIHFRIRTHGEKDLANCHPFVVLDKMEDGRDLYAMHNGILRVPQTNPKLSDTWHWIDRVARPFILEFPDLLQSEIGKELIEDSIGSNKLLFLDGTGQFTLLNPRSWTHHDGCMFSNDFSLFDDNFTMKSYYGASFRPKSSHILGNYEPAEDKDIRPLHLEGDEEENDIVLTKSGSTVRIELLSDLKHLFDNEQFDQWELMDWVFNNSQAAADLLWEAVCRR